jgi:hypothetical protein
MRQPELELESEDWDRGILNGKSDLMTYGNQELTKRVPGTHLG